jgi:hypothetical protein
MFNPILQKYQFFVNHNMRSLLYEPWGLDKDEIFDWDGFTATGATACFQIGIGPKQKV